MEYTLGIDIGTSFSSMAVVEKGLPRILRNSEGKRSTPSVIYFDKDRIIVGDEALELWILGEDKISSYFKRNIGNDYFKLTQNGRNYTAEDLTYNIIKKLKRDGEDELGTVVHKAVITVPAYFNNHQREATLNSGIRAGFQDVKILNEPTAAAIAYGMKNISGNKTVVVYDLGGGTFDVTLVKIDSKNIQVITSEGDHELGGKEWDDRLALYLVHKFNEDYGIWLLDNMDTYKNLLIKCEKYKKELSLRDKIVVNLNYFGHRGRYEITSEIFKEISKDLLERTITLTKKIISESNYNTGDIDGILLVGGSCKMPMIKEAIRNHFKKEPLTGVNLEEAVATGAAIYGDLINNKDKDRLTLPKSKKVVDVITHSLGMIARGEDNNEYKNSIIIRKNTKIPAVEKRMYAIETYEDRENYMEVYMMQGESINPEFCTVLGKYSFHGIEAMGSGNALIEITYSYDENSIVSVSAKQIENDKELQLKIERVEEDLQFLNNPILEENKTIMLAMDLSGSMCGEPLEMAEKAAIKFIEDSNLSNTEIGIVAFGDKVKSIQSFVKDKELLMRAVKKLEKVDVGVGTSNQPLSYALKEFSGINTLKYLVVLTDGQWYGFNNRNSLKLAEQCHDENIEIIALGFGEAEESFLKAIASCDENALYTSLNNLSGCFSRIAKEISKAQKGKSIKIFK
ncbi:Hsp70 family protein [uncultured Clostridium sp.]|uniref:Hsp70 family protein n=1 Tax=uncultured Clostridium sp. TaxID=59620 RepID=UPI0025FC93D2|nr:Hsp70 family protein [uncultured Clostridium sp.]